MKLCIGCDHAGYGLKDYLTAYMRKNGIEVIDLGGFDHEAIDYPVVGLRVGEAVAAGECDFGVLICGTGVGISITANKVPGVRAVVCSEPFTAVASRRHNNSNILALGARVVGEELAVMILEQWLAAQFEGGERHSRRVGLIAEVERKYSK